MSSLEQQQLEMTLTLCITGFCFAEAGKKSNLFLVARGRKRLKWKALKRAGAKRSDASRGLVKGAPLKVSKRLNLSK